MQDRLSGKKSVFSLAPQAAWTRISSTPKDKNPVIVDVRDRWAYRQCHIRGSVNIPLEQLPKRFSEIPTNRDVYVICQNGISSVSAVQLLIQEGYSRIINISGGIGTWRMYGLPL
jgi:rhodanese-related sulfurtransferase